MINNYAIGDRIIVNNKSYLSNECGKIIYMDSKYEDCFGIEFDHYIGGHSCGGIGKLGHCMYYSAKDFTLLCDYIDF